MGNLGSAHGGVGAKMLHSLTSVTRFLQWWNWEQIYFTQRKYKSWKNMNQNHEKIWITWDNAWVQLTSATFY